MNHNYLSIKVHLDRRFVSPKKLAEVVGSNPTRSISINLVIYGIELSSFLLDTFVLSNYSNKKEKLKKKEVYEELEEYHQLNLLLVLLPTTMSSAT